MTVIDNTVDFLPSVDGVELLIGAGNSREKQLRRPDAEDWKDLVTLDIDPNCEPNVVWDLRELPLPFPNDQFEEIHAYEILEHIGQQGDWQTFFAQFKEFHRILKPGGYFFATSLHADVGWAWSDPGHTRIISEGTIAFLEQSAYEEQVGKTPMTDYRHVYDVDFEIVHAMEQGDKFTFVLKKR